MRYFALSICLAATALTTFCRQAMADAHIFILKREGATLVLERITLAEGESKTWKTGEDGFVDVILPPTLGGSGSIIMQSMNAQTTAACERNVLSVKTVLPGKTYDREAPTAEELTHMDVRLSARCGDGTSLTAFIRGYDHVEVDVVGPLEDMFAGAVPLQPADCAITTNTFAQRTAAAALTGSAPVRMAAGHHVASAALANEGEVTMGDFVIDLAAATTVIAKSALPPGLAIEPSTMTQYTPEGVQRLTTEVGGATGSVSPLGIARIPVLTLGDIRLSDVSVLVMNQLPALEGEELSGIIGLDILSQASSVSLPYGMDEGQKAELRLGPASTAPAAESLPLSIFGNRAYCRATINGIEAIMILDSGSPWTILDERSASSMKLTPAEQGAHDIHGIGSASLPTSLFVPDHVALGTMSRDHVTIRASSLAVFKTLRGSTPIGLLGNDILGWADRVEVDFDHSLLRFFND